VKPLSEAQANLLRYLESCELSPSFAEIKDAMGYSSKSRVFHLLEQLEDRGFIRRMRNRARSIEIVEDPVIGSPPLSRYTSTQLAREARRRGLTLGAYHRARDGTRIFMEVSG
jgi:SOS-response transcriptional repressor LexA